jgi:hypothetical protein
MNFRFPNPFLFYFILCILCFSCNNDDPEDLDAPLSPKTNYTYVYSGEHKIYEFTMYLGPNGKKTEDIEPNINLIKRIWNTDYLNRPYNDTIIINFNKDSLYILSNAGNKPTHYQMAIKNDSIFIKESPKTFLGTINKDQSIINFSYKFKYVYKEGGLDSTSGNYDNGYKAHDKKQGRHTSEDFFFLNGAFKNPQDLKRTSDTLIWMNKYYILKKL